MVTFAVVKTGGKQYLVKEGMEIVVDRLDSKEKDKINLETLMTFDEEGKSNGYQDYEALTKEFIS